MVSGLVIDIIRSSPKCEERRASRNNIFEETHVHKLASNDTQEKSEEPLQTSHKAAQSFSYVQALEGTVLPDGNWTLVRHEAVVIDIFKNIPGEHVPNGSKLDHETVELSEGIHLNTTTHYLRSNNRYPCIEASVRQTLGEQRRGIMFATVFIV